ncbi:methyltransferase family protein [Oleiharenicola lentus]|uniref:methyltransferase family protein n=1 Tax=Oleiharenicola lentus TaxID=2508720 RepID=UPI003F66C3BC
MWLFLKNLIYNAVVLGFLLGWVPWAFLVRRATIPTDWSLQHFAAVPFALLGALVYLASSWQIIRKGRGTPMPFDPPQKVLTRGLYAWLRNPMYVGVLLIVVAEAIFVGGVVLWLYFVFLASVFQLVVRTIEENELRMRFGALYSDYCNQVQSRWIPRKPKPRNETIAPFGSGKN